MTYELKRAYTEVYMVLKNMPQEYINKIPNKITNLLDTSRIDNYKIDIDKQNPIDRTKLSKQAMTILAIFNYQYWCPNRKVKNNLYNQYLSNSKAHEKEIREKYNPDNLFKRNAITKEEEELEKNNTDKMLVIVKKENIFRRIINKIKNYFAKQ